MFIDPFYKPKPLKVPSRKTLLSWTLPRLDKLHWRMFSRWVRLKSADHNTGMVSCFICGATHHWTDMQCAHYVRRGHGATRYSVLNNHACCIRCNITLDGNLQEYKKRLNFVYGKGTAAKLEYLGKQTIKIDRIEYIDSIFNLYKKLQQYEQEATDSGD